MAAFSGEGFWTANGGAELRSADLELDWLVAVGPRVGYAFDRVFVYAKGGLAVAQEQYRHQNLFNGNTFSDEDIRVGFFAGTGVEYAISDNWSARLEYQYVDLGNEGVALSGPTGTAVFDVDQSMHVVKAGVNYRF